jgi:general secretion pathway protein E
MIRPMPFGQAGPALIGELLIREGLEPAHLERALAVQREEGGLIGEILVRMKAVGEAQLAKALAIQHELPWLEQLPTPADIDEDLIEALPITFAKQHVVLPYAREDDGRVLVLLADPLALDVLDDIAVMIDASCEGVVAGPEAIVDLINKVYGQLREGADLEHGKDQADEFADAEELTDLLDVTDEAPVIKWVNSLIFQAVKERASDIHIEPGEKDVRVRYRVDGVLREMKTAPRRHLPSILSRVKIMSGLNIAEKRLPLDGRIRRRIAGKDIDMRVATAPTANGERVTIRLLDRSGVLLGLPDIGMAADTLGVMRSLIRRPHGILLVSGPTGSGKTTTLYSSLSEIKSPKINILTVEDPVEYQLEGISQTQVNTKIDLTFAMGLRSFLRHDPDVIMVGEIRDRETAEIAINASLTGHLVFSTIHTNDAPGGLTRLIEMGVEPFLVTSTLIGIIAQRLVRRPCAECAEPVRPSEEALIELELEPDRFFAGGYELPEVKGSRPLPPGTVLKSVGCPTCMGGGYRGRTGIYEMMVIDDSVRKLTNAKSDASTIRKAAVERGMVGLRTDGARKVMLGMTTAEEVLMVTAETVD